MNMSKKTMAFSVLLTAVALAGCATTGGASNAANEILAALENYHAAMKAEDIEKLVDMFSDDFKSPDGGEKAVMEMYFESLIDMNAFDGMEVNLDRCEIQVDDGVATVGPVEYAIGGGAVSNRYTMKKESDGVWRITYSEEL